MGAVQYKCMSAREIGIGLGSGPSNTLVVPRPAGQLSSKGIYMVHGANAETFTAQYTVYSVALSRPTSRFEIDLLWSIINLYVNPILDLGWRRLI
jgi:hypothetical protein